MTSPRNPQTELPAFNYQKIQSLTTDAGGRIDSGGSVPVEKWYQPDEKKIAYRAAPTETEGILAVSEWNGGSYDLTVKKLKNGEVESSVYVTTTSNPVRGVGAYYGGKYYIPVPGDNRVWEYNPSDDSIVEVYDYNLSDYVTAKKLSSGDGYIVAVDPANDAVKYTNDISYWNTLTIAASATFECVKKIKDKWIAVGWTTPLSGSEVWWSNSLTSGWQKVVPNIGVFFTGKGRMFDVGIQSSEFGSDFDRYYIAGLGEYTGDPTYQAYFQNYIFLYYMSPYNFNGSLTSDYATEVPNITGGDLSMIRFTDTDPAICIFPGEPGVRVAGSIPSIQSDANDRFFAYEKIGGWDMAYIRKNSTPNNGLLRAGRFDPDDKLVENLALKETQTTQPFAIFIRKS
jgi:hypothetical protein